MQSELGSVTLPYETRRIDLADGTHRTVLELGEGEPFLLIHGLSGTHAHWGLPFLERLVAAGRRVITVNHVGVAGSSRSREQFSIVDLADAQAAALDALGIDGPVDVFGISMGGMTAQELALRHPGRVRSLVLGCTTAGASAATWMAQSDMAGLVSALQSGDTGQALRASWGINVSRAFAEERQDRFEEFSEATLANRVTLRILSEQMQAIGTHDTVDRLGRIAVPTTVAHGTEDLLLPYPNGLKVAEAVPGATLETFEGAGHLFFWEDPARAAEVALETASRAD
ncbi:alpha/beta fold hydrolase [Patulibacter minatonensis]|uniref:alpha/beta fold hydrolase n=1 Tax=Patulibacter minatonensis TaxID=298163 RepID=UPI000A060711|nr:alpha/beta hydrolase [Patulibacter minatonensis]